MCGFPLGTFLSKTNEPIIRARTEFGFNLKNEPFQFGNFYSSIGLEQYPNRLLLKSHFPFLRPIGGIETNRSFSALTKFDFNKGFGFTGPIHLPPFKWRTWSHSIDIGTKLD